MISPAILALLVTFCVTADGKPTSHAEITPLYAAAPDHVTYPWDGERLQYLFNAFLRREGRSIQTHSRAASRAPAELTWGDDLLDSHAGGEGFQSAMKRSGRHDQNGPDDDDLSGVLHALRIGFAATPRTNTPEDEPRSHGR